MATYTAITDAEIDQDSPITQTLMTKYRDNLTATVEGDASAPKIVADAMSGSVAGETLLFGTGGTGQVFGGGVVWAAQFRATTSCTVRVRGQFRRVGDPVSVDFIIRKNGSTVLSQSTTSESYQTSSAVDISLVAGDLILVSGNGNAGGTPNNPQQSFINMRDIKYTVGEQRTVGGI